MDSVKGVWYDITVAWDGAELTVSRGLNGGALTELFTAETTLENDSTDIGFGVGEKAEYRFDEVRLSSPSLSAEEPSKLTEYVYDALGRRVAVTDYVGASAGGLSRSINPIPPLVRHKSNRAWIPVLGHARWWVSFRFNACCCPARGCIVCTP